MYILHHSSCVLSGPVGMYLRCDTNTQNIRCKGTRVREFHRIRSPWLEPIQLEKIPRIQNVPTLKTEKEKGLVHSWTSRKKKALYPTERGRKKKRKRKKKKDTHLARQRELHLDRGSSINTHKRIPAIRAPRIRKRHVRIDVIHRYHQLARSSGTHVLERQRAAVTDEAYHCSCAVDHADGCAA